MASYNIRRCCAGEEIAKEILEPADLDNPILQWGELVGTEELELPARRLESAHHEAAHAVAAHAMGLQLVSVTIDARQAVTSFVNPAVTGIERPSEALAVLALVGDVAKLWEKRWVYRPYDEAVLPFIRAARAGTGGRCDMCRIASSIAAIVGDHADDAAFMATFRKVEDLAISLVKENWRAIRKLAGALVEKGTIGRSEAASLIEGAGTVFESWQEKIKIEVQKLNA